MFTLDQVNEVHDKFGKAGNLLEYAKQLNAIGVVSYDSFVSDGRTVFYGAKGHSVETPANHKEFIVTDWYDNELFQRVMKHANKGKIGYEEMAKELAKAGVEKWSMDTVKQTFVYSDAHGNPVLIEQLQ